MIKVLQCAILNSLETTTKSLNKEVDGFSKERKDTEKNQMEILELKNIATEVQHQNGRTEEQINELEDKK